MEAIEPRWRKSSYSGNGGNCVEVADHGNRVLVRDSKNPHGPMLGFGTEAWDTFTRRVKQNPRPS